MTQTRRTRSGAILLALMLTLSVGLTVSAATPANTVGRFPDSDNDGHSKITIHKYDLGDMSPGSLTLEGTGVEQNPDTAIIDGDNNTLSTLTPLDGIDFLIEFHKFDNATGDYTVAKTEGDWKAPPIGGGIFTDTLTYNGNPIYGYKGTTASGGLLTFSNLEFGKYIIYELNDSGYIGWNNPFTVYVPTQLLTNTTATEWIYDVHVYPKNYEVGKFEKFLLKNDGDRGDPAQGDAPHGNVYTWELEVELRDLDDGTGESTMEWLKIVDKITAPLLLDTGTVKLQYLEKGKTAVADREDLITPSHYAVEMPASTNDNTLTVTLDGGTGKGLEYLISKNAGTLILTITTFTDPENSKVGTVTNSGTYQWKLWDGDPGEKVTPDDKSPSTEVNDVTIKKVNDDATPLPMPGVKFILFKNETAALAYDGNPASLTDQTCVIANLSATSPDRYIFTSGVGGVIDIKNIESAFIPYGQSTPSVFYSYWLVEIKTDDGYNLLPAPVHIDFKVHPYNTAVEITVVNHKGFTLPHTGGGGTAIFTAVGLGLITIAFVVFLFHRRHKNRENEVS